MNAPWPLLSLLTFLPLLGVALIGLLSWTEEEKRVSLARWIALATSLATLGLSLCAWAHFDHGVTTGFQWIEKALWIPSFHIYYFKGIDGISLTLVLLTALITPLAILGGFSVQKRVPLFMSLLLLIETMLLGVFTSLDFVLFYIFFEGALIPMFIMIGLWGGEKRIYAAIKFFLYTFLGSVFMLIAIIVMAHEVGTTDMTAMIGHKFAPRLSMLLWLGFFASFAVKTPLWPFHTWLPYAHGEAPTAGSVVLAALLLKMGGYGFIRVGLQMLPEASQSFAPLMIDLAVIGIVYTSLVALMQTDFKRLIAYSSVAHMGYALLGIFSGTAEGLQGAMFVMVSHGLVSAALFLGAGVLYDRLHTREIARYGAVVRVMPRFAVFFMLFSLGAMGLPGTSGFLGEFLSLAGAWRASPHATAVAALGLILGAAYMLRLYGRLFYGPAMGEGVAAMPDLRLREGIALLPLVVLIIGIGVAPAGVQKLFAGPSAQIIESINLYPGAPSPDVLEEGESLP